MMLIGGLQCVQCKRKACTCLDCQYYQTLQVHHKLSDAIEDWARFDNDCDTMVSYYLRNPKEAQRKLEVLCCRCNNQPKNIKLRRYDLIDF